MAGITGVPSKPAAGLDNIRVPPLKFKEIELPSGEKKSVPIPQEDDEGEEEEQNSDKSGKDQQVLSFYRSLFLLYAHPGNNNAKVSAKTFRKCLVIDVFNRHTS